METKALTKFIWSLQPGEFLLASLRFPFVHLMFLLSVPLLWLGWNQAGSDHGELRVEKVNCRLVWTSVWRTFCDRHRGPAWDP